MTPRSGLLLLVSGPSGSGKSTLCRGLVADGGGHFSVSCTTRPIRDGEADGRDYHFLTPAQFQEEVEAGNFLEHAEVHGNRYGTLKSEVLGFLAQGKDVVMDIDVQGAAQVRNCRDPLIQDALVDLFVMPATEEELRARLTGRGTDSEEVIALRLANALEEMRHWQSYTYCILSGTREEDRHRLDALLTAERLRTARIEE